MPDKDPAHWLYRLDPTEWLAAAATDLAQGRSALQRRAIRPAVTHARRAAGMAANAVLWLEEHPSWGRSYMEHVAALADDTGVPAAVREAARVLRETPPQPPALVKLGPPDAATLDAAQAIIDWARERTTGWQAPLS
jgi:HEPN domain-containing protein